MASSMSFLLFISTLSLVTADTCLTDFKFTLSTWKSGSTWMAVGNVGDDASRGSNSTSDEHPVGTTLPAYYDYDEFNSEDQVTHKTPQEGEFSVRVDVSQCDGVCPNGPYVNITAYVTKNSTKILPDYDHFPGIGNYKFHTNPVTWDVARKTCNNEGAHLAVINSEEESKIFQDYLAELPRLTGSSLNDFLYIGFHDRFVKGEYITIFDEPLNETGFYRWADSTAPDNNGEFKFCGSVHRNGGLNNIFCNLTQAFICEQKLC